jgi:hypothetical protein
MSWVPSNLQKPELCVIRPAYLESLIVAAVPYSFSISESGFQRYLEGNNFDLTSNIFSWLRLGPTEGKVNPASAVIGYIQRSLHSHVSSPGQAPMELTSVFVSQCNRLFYAIVYGFF